MISVPEKELILELIFATEKELIFRRYLAKNIRWISNTENELFFTICISYSACHVNGKEFIRLPIL